MKPPVLIIVNGLPGAGKTTLAQRLATDLPLPIFARDTLYETLHDALECRTNGVPPLLGSAAFSLLYQVIGSVLAGGSAVIVEGYFGRPELRTAEFRRLKDRHNFVPFQILCRADGAVLLERFLARAGSDARHTGHTDLAWLEAHKTLLLQGHLAPLALDGRLVEIDTTTPDSFDYSDLVHQIRAALSSIAP